MYIDGHCDSLSKALDENKKLTDKELEFNFTDAKKPCIQICAAFVDDEYKDGLSRALNILDIYYKNKNESILVKNNEDINQVLEQEKLGILLSIENGKAIDNNLENIDLLYEKGVRMMGLTWNHDNLIGCGALTKNDTGLTDFGIKYVKKLEEKNIIIDISHCSYNTFWDVLKHTKGTIVASHSCAKSICNHPRNLTDEQIIEIAKRRGIIGICLSNSFLTQKGNASVKDIVKHIRHIINLVGEDYVGIGSDFDGVMPEHKLIDIKGIKDIYIIENEFKKCNFSIQTIKKIMGENWLRVIKESFI